MNTLRHSLVGLTLLLSIGCKPGPIHSGASPYIDFECNAAQSPYCTQSAHLSVVYMGLSSEAGFDCEAELLNLQPDLFVPSFDYSGFTLARFNGSFLTGMVTEWVYSSGGVATTMVKRDYILCSFVDLNNNGSLDIFEPLASETINPGADFYPVSQWYHL